MEHMNIKYPHKIKNCIGETLMRSIFILIFTILYFVSFAQNSTTETFKNDSLLVVKKNPEKGFYNDYILFIPKETPINKKIFLLVEPNNTGKTSDSIEIHKKYAIDWL